MCWYPSEFFFFKLPPSFFTQKDTKSFSVSNGGMPCNGLTLPQIILICVHSGHHLQNYYLKALPSSQMQPETEKRTRLGDTQFCSFSPGGTPQSAWHRVARTQKAHLLACDIQGQRLRLPERNCETRRQIQKRWIHQGGKPSHPLIQSLRVFAWPPDRECTGTAPRAPTESSS